MSRPDLPKTQAEWVKDFIHSKGMGARIMEGQEINAVCDYIAELRDMLERQYFYPHKVFDYEIMELLERTKQGG